MISVLYVLLVLKFSKSLMFTNWKKKCMYTLCCKWLSAIFAVSCDQVILNALCKVIQLFLYNLIEQVSSEVKRLGTTKFVPLRAMQTYGAVEVWLPQFLTFTLDADECSASRLGRFARDTHWIGGQVGPRAGRGTSKAQQWLNPNTNLAAVPS